MNKVEREKKTIALMINIYCKKKHKSKDNLCEECQELLNYANTRLSNCKFGEQKTTCGKCPIHCYKKDMRNKVKEVMKFSGPRLILYNPIEVIRHLFY
ncbi:Nitrous oxide-stimulated promoter [Clostridium collagenovorans DSM 3089]|uniref:Nitrous oxide-stimulated promoter n=1 Tax=Clostridium collagenovorans DSM 3089 TaxID=1121306 RepID=A0A1M5UXC3_9CLOT|nr:nitrous oxide-stimulated promoter family protein [Clostridium collagenovorans]SHH67580.1 Nitrous oxide-stimulated promoter [Clostridium collagenovorans DSM 3089]